MALEKYEEQAMEMLYDVWKDGWDNGGNAGYRDGIRDKDGGEYAQGYEDGFMEAWHALAPIATDLNMTLTIMHYIIEGTPGHARR